MNWLFKQIWGDDDQGVKQHRSRNQGGNSSRRTRIIPQPRSILGSGATTPRGPAYRTKPSGNTKALQETLRQKRAALNRICIEIETDLQKPTRDRNWRTRVEAEADLGVEKLQEDYNKLVAQYERSVHEDQLAEYARSSNTQSRAYRTLHNTEHEEDERRASFERSEKQKKHEQQAREMR